MFLYKLILFFNRSPQLDLLILLCCILYVTVPPTSPFERYDLLKNGKVVTGEVTQVSWLPSGTYIDYRYTTANGKTLATYEKTLDITNYQINENKLPQKIEVVYVPERPDRSWINIPRPYYNVATFWKDYLLENGIASLVLYMIIRTTIAIRRYLKRKKQQKQHLTVTGFSAK